MSQTNRQSMIETCASTAIGFVIAYVASYTVLPLFGHHVTHGQNFWITVIFTVISVIRGFAVRRLFNRLHGSRERPRDTELVRVVKAMRRHGMRDDPEPPSPKEAWAALDGMPKESRTMLREFDCESGEITATLGVPPEMAVSTRIEMERAGWTWISNEWTPRVPNVYMIRFVRLPA